jgi:hypothetical protein
MEPAKAPLNHHGAHGNLQAKAKVARAKAPIYATNGNAPDFARKVERVISVTTGFQEKPKNTPAVTPKAAKEEKAEEKAKPSDTALTVRQRLTTSIMPRTSTPALSL